MKHVLKVLSVVFLASLLFAVTHVTSASADGEPNAQVQIDPGRWELPSVQQQDNAVRECATGDKNCLERNTYSLVNGSLPGALLCPSIAQACGARSLGELQYFQRKSALAQSTMMIASLYAQPPASTSEYLAYVFNNAGLIPKTYAQGITYARLLPILPIWKAFRDIAYILLTFIMLFAGILIMMRQKVNPQTVASIENTIPKVIVTLLLITFSFPIAALIIDSMYLIIYGGIQIIGTAVGMANWQGTAQTYTSGGFGDLLGATLSPLGYFANINPGGTALSAVGTLGVLGAFLIPGIGPVVGLVGGALMGIAGVGGASSAGGDLGSGLLTILSPILLLIITVVLFFAIFKIFFMLLSNYIQIIVFIVFAPMILLVNALPQKSTFSYWWKSIAGNMIAFVVTAIMLFLCQAIAKSLNSQPFWTAPFIMKGAGISQMTVGLITLGIILLIPQFVTMAKGVFGNNKPFANVGPSLILGPAMGAVGQIGGLGSQISGWANVIDKTPWLKRALKRK